MVISDVKETVSSILSAEGCSAEFFFLVESSDGMQVKSVDIESVAHDELKSIFIKSLSKSLLLNDDLSLIPLSSADDRKDALYRYDLEDVPTELAYLKEIIEHEKFESFEAKGDELSNIKALLILIGDHDHQMALYKYIYPITLLKQDGGFNLFKPGGQNRFKKLDADLLKLNGKFEFFRIDEEYYIYDLKALERFFGFHDAVKNVAEIGIQNIIDADIVVDCSVFESRLDDISFARKLVKSANDSPVLGVIPTTKILEFTNNHPALKGKFKYSDDGSKLDLKTKKSQSLFLKLLNDNFLQSALTKLYYESVAKDSVENESSDG